MRGDAEALLQGLQRQALALMTAFKPTQHRLVFRQTAAHIQGFHHQARRRIPISAITQLLPQLPPALVGEQLSLVAAVQKRPRFAPQSIDQVVEINAPGTAMTFTVAVEPHQFTAELPAQQHLQTVMENPHRHPLADQPGRH